MKEDSIKLINKKIGERLRELRKSRKMKQEHMSNLFGISVPAYSKIETGVNEISIKHLLTIKREFDISIEWLLFGESSIIKAFGNNEEDVKKMLADMERNKSVLYSILSHYYGIVDAYMGKNIELKKVKP